jgi:hypothetical protein
MVRAVFLGRRLSWRRVTAAVQGLCRRTGHGVSHRNSVGDMELAGRASANEAFKISNVQASSRWENKPGGVVIPRICLLRDNVPVNCPKFVDHRGKGASVNTLTCIAESSANGSLRTLTCSRKIRVSVSHYSGCVQRRAWQGWRQAGAQVAQRFRGTVQSRVLQSSQIFAR